MSSSPPVTAYEGSMLVASKGSFRGSVTEADLQILQEEINAASKSRFSRKVRAALMTAGVCAVAAAAFSVGYFVAPSSVGGSSGSAEESPEDSLYAMVQSDVKLASSGAIGDMDRLAAALDTYLSTGEASDGLSVEFLEQLSKIAPPKEQRRLLRETNNKERLQEYGKMLDEMNANPSRRLDDADSMEFINQVFSYASNGVENMPNQVVFESDFGAVELRGTDCYIMVKETNDDADNSNNFNTRIIDVLNVEPSASGSYGSTIRASEGFAGAYNGMRLQFWSVINSECINKGATRFNFGGYSRGGAIVAIMSRALVLEGRLDASQVRLATYGAPRALARSDADSAHDKYEQWRLVFRGDPVPSVPYGWQGFRHYGWNICRSCSYSAGIDRPGFQWPNTNEHLLYGTWLPLTSFNSNRAHQNV